MFLLQGDEGSALMCITEGGVWQLQGVLSRRGTCGGDLLARPSVYSSIPFNRDWIDRTIGNYYTLIKKKIKFSSYLRKFRMEQVPSHITYMTNGLLIYGEIFLHFLIY